MGKLKLLNNYDGGDLAGNTKTDESMQIKQELEPVKNLIIKKPGEKSNRDASFTSNKDSGAG